MKNSNDKSKKEARLTNEQTPARRFADRTRSTQGFKSPSSPRASAHKAKCVFALFCFFLVACVSLFVVFVPLVPFTCLFFFLLLCFSFLCSCSSLVKQNAKWKRTSHDEGNRKKRYKRAKGSTCLRKIGCITCCNFSQLLSWSTAAMSDRKTSPRILGASCFISLGRTLLPG